ncbi:hypothetical protein DPMN_194663 [Dreissena polymorpha]|uniref:Uncharacterized protein n=1 Tax=Dreissena polymorpha TaxID=45954 RepID=A0A9D3XYG2_DREPO|nr:hypothetical protein DPMN_194663 [Dreissena polymorpha]
MLFKQFLLTENVDEAQVIIVQDIKEQGMTRMIMMMMWVIQIGFTIKESTLQTVKTRIRT